MEKAYRTMKNSGAGSIVIGIIRCGCGSHFHCEWCKSVKK